MTAELRTAVARQLADAKHNVENVIVVEYTGQEIVEHSRDKWSNDLVDAAKATIAGHLGLSSFDDLAADSATDVWSKLNAVLPVERRFQLPAFHHLHLGLHRQAKGVVHTHGSWLSGVSHTMRTVFNATEDDTLYVIGDPGWITGQSYLIAAPLVQGMTTVIAEGLRYSPMRVASRRLSNVTRSPLQGGIDFPKGCDDRPSQCARDG